MKPVPAITTFAALVRGSNEAERPVIVATGVVYLKAFEAPCSTTASSEVRKKTKTWVSSSGAFVGLRVGSIWHVIDVALDVWIRQ